MSIFKKDFGWGEFLFWFCFVAISFAAGYLAAIRPELKQALFPPPHPLQILSSKADLAPASLQNYLKDELQSPVQIDHISSWLDFLGHVSQSQVHALGLISRTWAEQLHRDGLIENWTDEQIKNFFGDISADFRRPETDPYFLPLYWQSNATELPDKLLVWGLVQIKDSPVRKRHDALIKVLTSPAYTARILRDSPWASCLTTMEESRIIPENRKPSYLRKLTLTNESEGSPQ